MLTKTLILSDIGFSEEHCTNTKEKAQEQRERIKKELHFFWLAVPRDPLEGSGPSNKHLFGGTHEGLIGILFEPELFFMFFHFNNGCVAEVVTRPARFIARALPYNIVFFTAMISIQNVKKQYGRRILFENLSISFTEQQRIGLIGANGSGKTSLLRMILGMEKPDSGVIALPSDITIGYLPQEVEVLGDNSPLSIVLEPFKDLLNVQDAYASIAGSLENQEHPSFQKALEKIDKIQRDLEFHDAFSLVSRAKAILAGLGVPSDKWESPVQSLSGGYRMRVVLGRLLLLRPQALLMDEPTNHLDIDSLIWLEKFLERFSGTLIVVSHDREFLNRMTGCTAEIHGGAITLYKGNYDGYAAYKTQREDSLKNASKNLERKIAQTERFIERFRSKATKASLVQSRVKQCEALKEELPELPQNVRVIHFSFPLSRPSGGVPLKAEHLSMAYNDVPVFSDVGFSVNRGDKIAIVGPNGTGKTTLLKALAQLITPTNGTVHIGHNADIRYYGQHVLEQLSPDRTLFETITDASGSGERTFIQNVLGAFLFSGDDVQKKVKVLSGGEKSRLALATILSNSGNVLVLDEPTNHLDIQSIEILADALEEFEGTVLFVSHNEYFISRVAKRIIEMRPGIFRDFPGTIDQYHEFRAAGYMEGDDLPASGQAGNDEQNEASVKQQRMKMREARKRITRKIEKTEAEIATIESEITAWIAVLHDPANASNFKLLHETQQKIDTTKKANEALLGDWENFQEELGKLGCE
jgi:ATP-binding cassette subfamily F protein 3